MAGEKKLCVTYKDGKVECWTILKDDVAGIADTGTRLLFTGVPTFPAGGAVQDVNIPLGAGSDVRKWTTEDLPE